MRLGSFCIFMILTIASPTLAATMQLSPELRAEATQFCTGDAMRLCLASIMSETEIFACMRANRAQLSPSCRAVMDKGLRSTRR